MSTPVGSDAGKNTNRLIRVPRVIANLSKRIPIVIAVLAVALAAVFLFSPTRFFAGSAPAVEEIKIEKRSLSFTVTCSGSLRATSVENYGAPAGFDNYWQWQIVGLVPEGKNVKTGDVLVNFDTQKISQDLHQLQSDLDQANKEMEKTRVQIEMEESDLNSRLAEAQNKYETLKLKQATNPNVEASIKIEKDRLAVEEAAREVQLLKEWIDSHKKSSEASYKIIASRKARAENKVAEIQKAMENFQAKADRDGVAVYKLKWNGDRFQVGENVWSGEPIIEIPDMTTIVADASVPEVDVGKVKIGQSAEVTIDALPGKPFTGRVTGLGKLVHAKSWDIPNRILDADITLDQLDTSIMRPAMTVKIKIETRSISDVIAVPLRCVRPAGDGGFVKVKSGTGWRDHWVRLGESNGSDVVIVEGLRVGDRIAADYAKAK